MKEDIKNNQKLDKIFRDLDITRVEVIGSAGRAFQRWNIELDTIFVQDEGRTLKIFIHDKHKEES